MLRGLEKKYPNRAKLIYWLDTIIDVVFWIVVLLVFFAIKDQCDPTVICGHCIGLAIDPYNLTEIPFNVTSFIG